MPVLCRLYKKPKKRVFHIFYVDKSLKMLVVLKIAVKIRENELYFGEFSTFSTF